MLRKITIERREDGRFVMLREHEEGGDRWVCDDLLHAFDIVSKGYRPDGSFRETERYDLAQT